MFSKLSLYKGPVIPWEEQTSPGWNLSKNYKESTWLLLAHLPVQRELFLLV